MKAVPGFEKQWRAPRRYLHLVRGSLPAIAGPARSWVRHSTAGQPSKCGGLQVGLGCCRLQQQRRQASRIFLAATSSVRSSGGSAPGGDRDLRVPETRFVRSASWGRGIVRGDDSRSRPRSSRKKNPPRLGPCGGGCKGKLTRLTGAFFWALEDDGKSFKPGWGNHFLIFREAHGRAVARFFLCVPTRQNNLGGHRDNDAPAPAITICAPFGPRPGGRLQQEDFSNTVFRLDVVFDKPVGEMSRFRSYTC